MSPSSNDLLADRRFAWAQAMMEEGDHVAAAEILEQAMERVPGWPPGWAALADARERAGDLTGARAAWERVGALDPDEALGARLHLARLDGRTPAAMPEGYVRALFNDYAPRFDRHLTEALAYRGPGVLADALARAAPGRRFSRALDLGCGTGLMGLALEGRAGRIDGVDLSPAMVERARATGAYADLAARSLESALGASAEGVYDLVIAADVFVYLGDLAPVVAGAARVLARRGLLAFTVQALPAPEQTARGYRLGPDMRFCHAPGHVGSAIATAGLDVDLMEAASTRTERGLAVPGLVVVASKA